MAKLTFDQVVSYVKGLVGRNVRISAGPSGLGETGAFVEGPLAAVHTVPAGNPPNHHGLYRHFCQVGERRGNGFILSPHDFEEAFIDLWDPGSYAVRIKFKNTDFEVKIPDDRLTGYDQPLPGTDRS